MAASTSGGAEVLKDAYQRQWVFVSSPLDQEIRRRVGVELMRAQPNQARSVSSFVRRAVLDYLRRYPVPRDWRPEKGITPGVGFDGEAQTRERIYMWIDAESKAELRRRVGFEREAWERRTKKARESETPDERALRIKWHGDPRRPAAPGREHRVCTWPDPPTVSSLIRRALREWLRRHPA